MTLAELRALEAEIKEALEQATARRKAAEAATRPSPQWSIFLAERIGGKIYGSGAVEWKDGYLYRSISASKKHLLFETLHVARRLEILRALVELEEARARGEFTDEVDLG